MLHDPANGDGELEEALDKIEDEIRNGIRHGFFDSSIRCEIINGGKRRLTITAGLSYRYVVCAEDAAA